MAYTPPSVNNRLLSLLTQSVQFWRCHQFALVLSYPHLLVDEWFFGSSPAFGPPSSLKKIAGKFRILNHDFCQNFLTLRSILHTTKFMQTVFTGVNLLNRWPKKPKITDDHRSCAPMSGDFYQYFPIFAPKLHTINFLFLFLFSLSGQATGLISPRPLIFFIKFWLNIESWIFHLGLPESMVISSKYLLFWIQPRFDALKLR